MAESVSLASILDAHHNAQMENAHTAMPCRVVSYNASDNTVAAQPLVKRPGFAEDGTTKHEELPTYPHVPVAFPRAGSFVLYLPVTAGSYGTLIFFDIAPGEAFSTGQVSAPTDVSRHSGGYCFFIPGAYPFTAPIGDNPANMYVGVDGDEAQAHFSTGEIRLGKTATDYVVLASALQDALVTAVTAAVIVPLDGGASLKTTLIAALNSGSFLTAISAAITKAK